MKDEPCCLFSLNLSSVSSSSFSLLIPLHPSSILLQVGFLIAARDIKYSWLTVFMGLFVFLLVSNTKRNGLSRPGLVGTAGKAPAASSPQPPMENYCRWNDSVLETVRGKFQVKEYSWLTVDWPPGCAGPKPPLLSQRGKGRRKTALESWTTLPIPTGRVCQHEICSQVCGPLGPLRCPNHWAQCCLVALPCGVRAKWKLTVDQHCLHDLIQKQCGHRLTSSHPGPPLACRPSQQSTPGEEPVSEHDGF